MEQEQQGLSVTDDAAAQQVRGKITKTLLVYPGVRLTSPSTQIVVQVLTLKNNLSSAALP